MGELGKRDSRNEDPASRLATLEASARESAERIGRLEALLPAIFDAFHGSARAVSVAAGALRVRLRPILELTPEALHLRGDEIYGAFAADARFAGCRPRGSTCRALALFGRASAETGTAEPIPASEISAWVYVAAAAFYPYLPDPVPAFFQHEEGRHAFVADLFGATLILPTVAEVGKVERAAEVANRRVVETGIDWRGRDVAIALPTRLELARASRGSRPEPWRAVRDETWELVCLQGLANPFARVMGVPSRPDFPLDATAQELLDRLDPT